MITNVMPKSSSQTEKPVLHFYTKENLLKGTIYDPMMKKLVKYHLRCNEREAINHVANIRDDSKEDSVEFQFVIHR